MTETAEAALRTALAKAITVARMTAMMTAVELAAATELTPSYISEIKHGRRMPSIRVLVAIATATKISPATLMELILNIRDGNPWPAEFTRAFEATNGGATL